MFLINLMNKQPRQLDWDDAPGLSATITSLVENIDQCAIYRDGIPVAHLFILKDGLMGILEIDELADPRPADDLALAIGRIAIDARTAAREGRDL